MRKNWTPVMYTAVTAAVSNIQEIVRMENVENLWFICLKMTWSQNQMEMMLLKMK